jgi:hypothetical protein
MKSHSLRHSRHGSNSHCLPTCVPEIDAAESSCPDTVSPTSPLHDAKTDPFDLYQAHEKQHERQGHSRLSFSEQPEPEPEAQQESESEPVVENLSDDITTAMVVALALESVMDTDEDSNGNGKPTERHVRHHRLRKERHTKAREQLYCGDERVEEAVRRELSGMGIAGEKQMGVVEVGVIAGGNFEAGKIFD